MTGRTACLLASRSGIALSTFARTHRDRRISGTSLLVEEPPDAAGVMPDSMLRFPEGAEIEADQIAHGYQILDASDRPGLEFVFIAERLYEPTSGRAALGERRVLAALLDRNHHLIRDGQILLADKGFAGKDFKKVTAAMGVEVLRPDRKDETYTHGNLGGVRQWIESVNQTLKGQLDLERHGARTPAGGFTRITQRLLAMAAGIWHNWTYDVTSKRSLTAFDH